MIKKKPLKRVKKRTPKPLNKRKSELDYLRIRIKNNCAKCKIGATELFVYDPNEEYEHGVNPISVGQFSSVAYAVTSLLAFDGKLFFQKQGKMMKFDPSQPSQVDVNPGFVFDNISNVRHITKLDNKLYFLTKVSESGEYDWKLYSYDPQFVANENNPSLDFEMTLYDWVFDPTSLKAIGQ